jgi:hypothetical protein
MMSDLGVLKNIIIQPHVFLIRFLEKKPQQINAEAFVLFNQFIKQESE